MHTQRDIKRWRERVADQKAEPGDPGEGSGHRRAGKRQLPEVADEHDGDDIEGVLQEADQHERPRQPQQPPHLRPDLSPPLSAFPSATITIHMALPGCRDLTFPRVHLSLSLSVGYSEIEEEQHTGRTRKKRKMNGRGCSADQGRVLCARPITLGTSRQMMDPLMTSQCGNHKSSPASSTLTMSPTLFHYLKSYLVDFHLMTLR